MIVIKSMNQEESTVCGGGGYDGVDTPKIHDENESYGKSCRITSQPQGQKQQQSREKLSIKECFKAELNPNQPWFTTTESQMLKQESKQNNDNNNNLIEMDMAASFEPFGWKILVWKIFATGLAIHILISSKSPFPWFFAYITSWGVVLCILYLILSLIHSLLRIMLAEVKQLPQEKLQTTTASPAWMIRLTWILFVQALHTSAMAIGGWVFAPPQGIDYFGFAAHGLTTILLLIDGCYVNSIPIRVMYWYGFTVPILLLWIIWSLFYEFVLNIENPEIVAQNDPSADTEVIYPIVNWKDNFVQTFLIGFAGFFVYSPIVFFILWIISRKITKPRHYDVKEIIKTTTTKMTTTLADTQKEEEEDLEQPASPDTNEDDNVVVDQLDIDDKKKRMIDP